ncbi:OmpP1/FadL family transporter [Persicobacter sp. CCB-QB2]|uniref:OmpP1/FadL family transporter n=1 Tax=Persicobacter sp. CCB-QB2 TaxID=1561025 RepID=UPI0006A9E440|nr:outer membrane protein transport protein [Persicobacter sp. CCB-QB2]
MKKGVLLLGMLVMIGMETMAAGYQVLLQGNRNTAMGNLGVGLQPDPSSIFWNPGALAMAHQSGVALGVNIINSKINYWDSETPGSSYTTTTDSPLGTPFHVYGAFQPKNSEGEYSNWAFGLGVYTPYGSSVEWDPAWKGNSLLQSIDLQAIFFQPTVSYRISDRFSVGAGLVISTGSVNLQRGIPQVGPDAGIELDGSADIAFGYNVGLYFQASEMVNLAFSYRSKVDAAVKGGDVTFKNIPASIYVTGLFPEGGTQFDATLPLPSVASVGVTVTPDEKVTIGFEGNIVGWSAYQSLTFDFVDPINGELRTSSPRDYENALQFKLGAEYLLTPAWALRAGIYYDQTPVQDGYMTPETPGADRTNLTFGFGWMPTEHLRVDASFLWVNGQERRQSFADAANAGTIAGFDADGNVTDVNGPVQEVMPGTYKSTALIGGVTVTYLF